MNPSASQLSCYKNTLSFWLEHEAEELSVVQLKNLVNAQSDTVFHPEKVFEEFLSFCQAQELIAQNTQGFFITPKGVRFQEKKWSFTAEEIKKKEQELVEKIQAWNFLASKHSLSQVGVLVQFGSTVAKNKATFGDIDVAILWQKPAPSSSQVPPLSAQKQMFGALSVLTNLPQEPTSWATEDAVEAWLEKTQGVSLTSCSDLQMLSQDEPFNARILYQQGDIASSVLLKKHEQDTLVSLMPLFGTSKAPPHQLSFSF